VPGSPTYWRALPIIRPPASTNCCPGTGRARPRTAASRHDCRRNHRWIAGHVEAVEAKAVKYPRCSADGYVDPVPKRRMSRPMLRHRLKSSASNDYENTHRQRTPISVRHNKKIISCGQVALTSRGTNSPYYRRPTRDRVLLALPVTSWP
jgi:hypothetical protein